MAPHVQAALAGGAQARMAQPGVVQRADEDIYKKNYKKRAPVTPRLSRKAKTEHKTVRSGKPSQRAQRLAGIVTGPSDPGYLPLRDQGLVVRNAVWDGRRNSLYWFDNVKAAMAAVQVQCDIQKASCTGGADGIDHIQDFADLQTGLTRYVICDGNHHFSAVYKEDALVLFNGGNAKATAVLNVDATNLQWSCTNCNSSKNGTKGVYENIPKWIEACPGNCGYSFRGQEAED
jgi:hypothetical protein